jgi:hypothetical protein
MSKAVLKTANIKVTKSEKDEGEREEESHIDYKATRFQGVHV